MRATVFVALALFASIVSAAPGLRPSDPSQSAARRSLDFETRDESSSLRTRSSKLAGTYHVINKAPGPNDEQLAMTFGGVNKDVTVTTASNSLSQEWIITYQPPVVDPSDAGYTLRPAHSRNLQVVWVGGNAIETDDNDVPYVWTIKETGGEYTIGDFGTSDSNWHIDQANNNAVIQTGTPPSGNTAKWTLKKVA
jgi:hypothetical protein